MNENRLRVVSSSDDRVVAARMARNARIDKLGVNRDVLRLMPKQVWSPEALAREPRFESIRASVTVADRIAAWRILFTEGR